MTTDFTATTEDTLLLIKFKLKLCAHLMPQTEASERAYVSVMLATYIREEPGSNVSRDKDYIDRG
jgi:hypothetical protein